MAIDKLSGVVKLSKQLESAALKRIVLIDFYLPPADLLPAEVSLLLINDGQDMEKLGLCAMLEGLYKTNSISPLLCVGIHASKDRKMEYGTASHADYKGNGAKATAYTKFVFEELLPFIRMNYLVAGFKEKAFAGFSLGGLSALDIVWANPAEFAKVGVFSGSLWWRTKDQNDPDYSDDTDRIMHNLVRDGGYYPWLKFFFECGAGDELHDRNHNGIIDSIDDTRDIIQELADKGYQPGADIAYLELADGKHDVPTWARAMPEFLRWGWGTGISRE